MNKEKFNEFLEGVKVPTGISNSLSGKYKIYAIDKNNNIVKEYPWQKNLILNQGMEAVPTHLYATLMDYAAAGNGTRNNSIISADSSGSVFATTFFLIPGILSGSIQGLTGSYGGYNNVAEIGDMIQFSDASEVRITAVSNLSASITPSTIINTQSFVIWKTSQQGLQSEVHRVGSANYFVGTGYCGTTIVSNVTQNRRTWDFNYETSSISFTEVGVGWAASGNGTIFSRILLPSSIFVDSAQKLRLTYELDIAMYPTASTPGQALTSSIVGWGTGSTVHGYQTMGSVDIGTIDTNGIQSAPAGGSYFACEPAGLPTLYVTSNTDMTGGPGASKAGNGSGSFVQSLSEAAYIPLNFTVYKTGTFSVSQINRNDLRTLGIGNTVSYNPPWVPGWNVFSYVLTENQTKTNVQTLSLTFIWQWGRVLS